VIRQGALNAAPSTFRDPKGSPHSGKRVKEDSINRSPTGRPALPGTIFDGEIRGPWSRYANVWRVAFRPISSRFLEDGDRYFFR
jgi:hypothetical protein